MPLYAKHWTLEQFPGPSILTSELGSEQGKLIFLPIIYLNRLYDRFRAANADGTCICIDESYYNYLSRKYTPEQEEELYAERKLLVDITETDADKGLPHLRRYLPEIFDPKVITTLEQDIWLNIDMMGHALRTGAIKATGDQDVRWSPEWRAYCDRLIADRSEKD
jgi:hypothetical protein